MSLFPAKCLAIVFTLLLPRTSSSEATYDPRLLALVPPGSQNVAGLNPAPPNNWHARFLLITRRNAMDMEDFLALSGGDASRVLHHVVLAAEAAIPGRPEQHSLLASGHFDQARIYQSAIEAGAASLDYRGLGVVAINPLPRERNEMDEIRWLAVVDSSLLLFGSAASVQLELDRKLIPGTVDPELARMVTGLRRDDDAWSVVFSVRKEPAIRSLLTALNPELARVAAEGTLRFGIHYGRMIEFEYAVEPSLDSGDQGVSDLVGSFEPSKGPASFSLFASPQIDRTNGVIRRKSESFKRPL